MKDRIISLVSIALLVACCIFPTAPAKAQIFKPRVDYGVGERPHTVDNGDLNGDGHPDLVSACFNDNTVSVLLGNGDGTFQPAVNYMSRTNPHSASLADFNRDGILDIAVANYISHTSGIFSILLGNGDGTFQSAVYHGGTAYGSSFVAAGDLDGNGDTDLVVANFESGQISVHLGNGDGTFLSADTYTVGLGPETIEIEDLDLNGYPDLIVANVESDTVSVLKGNGDGTFQSPVHYDFGDHPRSIAIGDLNGDGMADLATGNYFVKSASILFGRGDGTFEDVNQFEPESWPNAVAIEDLDGDGIPDLAMAGSLWDVSVMLGNGDGTFLPPVHAEAETGAFPYAIAVDDLNGDGSLDLAVVDYNFNTIMILINLRDPGVTMAAQLTCKPASGTVPFESRVSVNLLNRCPDQQRRVAASIRADLANGQSFVNWRTGYTDIAAGSTSTASWLQPFPALRSLIWDNLFTLTAADVTPAPWNQPPYRTAGYMAEDACIITAFTIYTLPPLSKNGYPE